MMSDDGITYLENLIAKDDINAANYYCWLLIKGKLIKRDLVMAKKILKKFVEISIRKGQ